MSGPEKIVGYCTVLVPDDIETDVAREVFEHAVRAVETHQQYYESWGYEPVPGSLTFGMGRAHYPFPEVWDAQGMDEHRYLTVRQTLRRGD